MSPVAQPDQFIFLDRLNMAEDPNKLLDRAFLYLKRKKNESLILKDEQKQALLKLLEGNDVLAVLPTGFGKSLIFTLFGLAKNDPDCAERASTVIVISPLKSIVADQLSELEAISCSAAELNGETWQSIIENPPLFVYSSAEEATQPRFMQAIKEEKLDISLVVVDESHTVESWTGKRKTTDRPFREAYGKLGSLRSMCKQGVPLLALTGTADSTTQNTIRTELVMKNALTIFLTPNRINVKFTVTKVSRQDMLSQVDWIVEMVKIHGIETPKTVIFCPTLNAIASLANYLMFKLGKHAFHLERKRECCLIGIFHSMSHQQYKERVSESLKRNGLKRVVLATTALSMGVNFPDIRYVVLWGPPRNILDFHQEVGRAGRDGLKSNAITYYYGQQMAHCDDAVRAFLKCDGCERVGAYMSLDPAISSLLPLHDCCSFCSRACSCGSEDGCVLEKPMHVKYAVIATANPPVKSRKVSQEEREILVQALNEIKDGLSSPVTLKALGGNDLHGFSDELIKDVSQYCHLIFTMQDLYMYAPVFLQSHALKIMEILNDIFGDCQTTDLDCCDNDMLQLHVLSEYDCELWE